MSRQAQRRSGILTSVIALLFLVGTLPLALLGVFLTRSNRLRLEVQQQEHQLLIAESLAREVSGFLRAERGALEGFARGIQVALGTGDGAAMLASLGEGRVLDRCLEQDLNLVKLVCAIPGTDPLDPRRLAFLEAARVDVAALYGPADEPLLRALERGVEGEPTVAVGGGSRTSLVLAQPVVRQDSVAAVLAAVVSLEELRERLEALAQELYDVYITDAAGRPLVRDGRSTADALAVDNDLVRSFVRGGGTRTMPFQVPGEDGPRPMLGAFASVPETGWGVFVQIDAELAYHAVHKMRQTTLAWSLASLLLALVLGTLFAGRLVRPIHELARGARRLARGDFSEPIRLRSRNELGLLADSFNHMADEIADKLDKLAHAARENKELFLGSIRMLAEAIDEKDPYTRGHSERVTRYAVATARALGMSEEEVERVHIGALLHDVGKIGIDDRILRKPTALTDEEFDIMKQHPEKGAHILGSVRQLADIVPGMRFHHEKVDGSGYPLGLRGDAIPAAAQIISVADTFDAMTTDRPYQRGMDPEYVIEKLHAWVGSRFRDDVVSAFERAYRAGQIEVRTRRSESEVAASPPAARSGP